MRIRCVVLFCGLGAFAFVAAACQNARMVRVCDPCGCECVGAPILASQPCGTRLTGDSFEANAQADSSDLAQQVEETKLTLAVSDQSFDDVVKTLQLTTGFNITVDPRLAAELADQPVAELKLEDETLATILNMLAAQGGEGIGWEIRDGVILFTRYE